MYPKILILSVLMIAVLVSSGCLSTQNQSTWDETSYRVTKTTWCYGECLDDSKERLRELEELTGILTHEEWQEKFEENEVLQDNCMIICEYSQGEQLILDYNKTNIKEECEDKCIPTTKTNNEFKNCMKECVDQALIRV